MTRGSNALYASSLQSEPHTAREQSRGFSRGDYQVPGVYLSKKRRPLEGRLYQFGSLDNP